MSDVAIRLRGIGKQYRLGPNGPYGTLRDAISRAATAPLRALRGRPAGGPLEPDPRAELWALRDVTLDIPRGEVVGVVGRNGAGKTTLMRILSGITEPTEGFAELHGRVGSLLELGTGFHAELTGRENVYLSGAIIGMRKREIDRKFDEIVAFAEIERFIDTPVKRYSAGMFVRLAFAVAAHLEADIMLVDEVLAVGDLRFQRRCLGKMDEVARGGRTVVFVSHQLNQIRRLCTRCVWLDGGQVRAVGRTPQIVSDYETGDGDETGIRRSDAFVGWEVAPGGHVIEDSETGVTFRIEFRVERPISDGHLGLAIQNDAGMVVVGWAFEGLAFQPGVHSVLIELPSLPLRPGSYALLLSLFNRGNNLTGGEVIEIWHATPRLRIETPPLTHPQDEWAGVLNVPAKIVYPLS
jgi:ABC-type polysaccharide/polyol phosphate transport system ATPase subunit